MDDRTDHGGATWAAAIQATLHCLTGCAIGEVLGMAVGTAAGLHNAATVVLSIVLAFGPVSTCARRCGSRSPPTRCRSR